jgi:hypothetical protein
MASELRTIYFDPDELEDELLRSLEARGDIVPSRDIRRFRLTDDEEPCVELLCVGTARSFRFSKRELLTAALAHCLRSGIMLRKASTKRIELSDRQILLVQVTGRLTGESGEEAVNPVDVAELYPELSGKARRKR